MRRSARIISAGLPPTVNFEGELTRITSSAVNPRFVQLLVKGDVLVIPAGTPH